MGTIDFSTINQVFLNGTEMSALQLNGTTVWEKKSKYEYVDLGLPSGLLWAKCNVGATSEEGYGYYFSWGNIDGHCLNAVSDGYVFDSDTYQTTKGYNVSSDIMPDSGYDAARENMGSTWRMPTMDDFAELVNSSYTSIEWTTINGVNGSKITSKVNSNYIFIPAGGVFTTKVTLGTHWVLPTSQQIGASCYFYYGNSSGVSSISRPKYYGRTIRAVKDK